MFLLRLDIPCWLLDIQISWQVAWATGLEAPATEKPHLPVMGKWGWKDGWFSETGLLTATEDEAESTEAEKGGGAAWHGLDEFTPTGGF